MSYAWRAIAMGEYMAICRWEGHRIWATAPRTPTAAELAEAIGRAMWAWLESRNA